MHLWLKGAAIIGKEMAFSIGYITPVLFGPVPPFDFRTGLMITAGDAESRLLQD